MKTNGNRKQNIIALVRSMKPYNTEMLLTILCSFFKHMSVIAAAALTSYMVGLAMQERLSQRFPMLFGILIACILLRAVLYYGEMWFGHDVAFRVLRDFRISLYKKVEEISPAYILKEQTGKLGQTLVGDVEVLELFLAHTFGAFVVAIIVTVIVVLMIALISPVLAAIMLIFAIILGVIPYIMKKRADEQGYNVRDKMAQANSTTIEGIQGLRELLTLNYVERYKQKNADHMQQLYDAQLKYGKRQGIESMLTQICVGFFTIAVISITAGLVANKAIDFALYPVAVMLAAMLFSPILEVTSVAQSLGLVFAAANRVQMVLSASPNVADQGKGTLNSSSSRHIEFDKVSFRYNENTEKVLHEASFTVEQGQIVALVGHSGAGKTTCANLLMRYWDTEEGEVKIDGMDIRDISVDSLRNNISAVPQETYLFNTTIRENIRLGKPDASDSEVEAAAKAAYAHEFILDLSNGYDTLTGERGFQLSGGQRQRIAIARVLLKNSAIVVFDEAVSNLDTENEWYIQQTLKTQLKGRTILLIAHRLSTILAADKIVVLKDGQIMQTGTHAELLQDDYYKSLIFHQISQAE